MSRRRCLLVAAVLIGSLAPAVGPNSLASSSVVKGGADRDRPGTVSITLVTGDRVTLRGGAVASIDPGPGRDDMRFGTFWLSGDLHVIPTDAGGFLAADLVDERLFNVTQQVEWGYDDARLGSVPLIVEQPATTRRDGVTGLTVQRSFGDLGIDAARVDKSEAGGFWRDLTTSPTARLDAGVRKLWLDGQVQASLDQSVQQIGAPAAWRRGLTGKGVKVAVLDTGYDADHPDLAGAVVQSKGFTDLGPDDLIDYVGHGTHVASTITGSGAASDGRYKGVAPKAKLAIGKVLSFGGFGFDSWTIAGMRWAARTADADIVNLSLGGTDFRGVDPVERAVNQLTRETGALFVVAAGNSGEFGRHTVGSPASATAALAVGAVNDRNRLAPFSSRGPVVGSEAVKPDLTAPGVAIKAAVPGGGYAASSGTSMATPHVAGAAAILAQQHPKWRAVRLKAALVGSARPAAGFGEFAQGAGRVAIARAVRQPIVASSGNLSTVLRYPQHRTVVRPLTYTNGSDRPITLELSELAAPFALETTEVTIPAGGSRTVDVTISAQGVSTGAYSDTLVARSGKTVVRTVVGAHVEPESYNLRLDVVDRLRVEDDLLLVHSQTTGFHAWVEIRDQRGQVRLPADDYNVAGGLISFRPKPPNLYTVLNQPVDLTADDVNVVLDLDRANRATMTIDDPSAVGALASNVGVIYVQGGASYAIASEFGWDAGFTRVLPVEQDGLTYFHLHTFGQQEGTLLRRNVYHVVDWREGGIPADPSYAARVQDLAKVTATYKGTVANSRAEVWVGLMAPGAVDVIAGTHWAPIPGSSVRYFTPGPMFGWMRQVSIYSGRIFYDLLDDTETPPTYTPGEHRETWNAAVLGPALPERCVDWFNAPRGPCAYRTGDTIVWDGLDNFVTDSGAPGRRSLVFLDGTGTLRRNGELIRRCRLATVGLCTPVRVPPASATFRLAVNAHRYDWDPTRLTTEVRTAYTFESGHTDEETALPFIAVRYAPEGLGLQNRAAAGSTTTIPIWIETYGPAPIESLTVEASYDDGATWHALDVERDGADWVTSVDNPDSGFVSLRAVAVDSDGNSVRQVIVRAYEIRR